MAREVKGLREALRALRRINEKLERKGFAVALSAGLQQFLPDVIAHAPENEGAYKSAITITKVRKRLGSYVGGIALDKNKLYTATGGRRPTNLPALLEYGHAQRYRDETGKLVDNGTVPAKPHWRPAFEARVDDATDAVRDALHAFVLDAAHSAAIGEDRLHGSLARAERSLAHNLERAARAEARGQIDKAKAYRAKAHKAEGRRLKYSRKLGR
jgi:hypothetical protein